MFVDELSVAKKEQKGSAKKEGMPDNPNSASTKTNQKKSEVTESVYTKEKRFKTSTSLKGDTLNLPKRQILQKHRKWEKAFKPLKLSEDDKHEEIIDIKQTVDFIAQTQIEQVIFKAKKREIYTLNLLIDHDKSMEIFSELIDEFVNAVQHYGVFVSVHLFYLDGAVICRDKSFKLRVDSLAHFSQKNSLTLIVSNCLSAAWKNNEIFQKIEALTKYSFCSIVQMLPSHLWLSTALGRGTQLTFKWDRVEVKAKNRTLYSDDESYFFTENQKLLKVPIIAFEPSAFHTWSSFVTQDRRFHISGMAFDNIELEEVPVYEFTGEERLEGFLENSTPEAKGLASYMANLPVSFDVARMIQEEKFSNTNITHLAEVFLGGIIKRVETKQSTRYLFRAEPRAYLKEFVSPYDAYELLEKFVSRNPNSSLNLSAFFANKQGIESIPIDEETLELMRLGIDIKKRMGGIDYDEAVQRESELETKLKKSKIKVVTPRSKRFQMGSEEREEEQPIHEVIINYDFEIAQTPVTVGEFRAFVEDDGYVTEAEKGDGAYVWDGKEWNNKKDASWKNPYFEQSDEHPVVCVSWNDAQAYIEWLNKKTGETYRLPTEAEWEFSCRAGTTTKWHFGDDENELEKYAWYGRNNGDGTESVATKEPNQWGLYDMHGNVWEWCLDDYEDNYNNTPRDGTGHKLEEKKYKSLRGGSWLNDAVYTRSSFRNWVNPANRDDDIGFRLLRTLP